MRRAYYSSSITDFLAANPNAIIGELTRAHARNLEQTQLNAWLEQINILKRVLTNRSGRIYFEYAIPRMGKRIDVVLLIGPVIFVLEFKVGESHFTSAALDQVTDYCLDLKNFHETSLNHVIAPVLIATASRHTKPIVCETRGGAFRGDIDQGSSPTVSEGLSDENGARLDSRRCDKSTPRIVAERLKETGQRYKRPDHQRLDLSNTPQNRLQEPLNKVA